MDDDAASGSVEKNWLYILNLDTLCGWQKQMVNYGTRPV
jgi:hypothetical protein